MVLKSCSEIGIFGWKEQQKFQDFLSTVAPEHSHTKYSQRPIPQNLNYVANQEITM